MKMNLVGMLMVALESEHSDTLECLVKGRIDGFRSTVEDEDSVTVLNDWRFKVGFKYVIITYSNERTAKSIKVSKETWKAIQNKAERILCNRKRAEERKAREIKEQIRKDKFYKDLCEAVKEHPWEVLNVYENCRHESKRLHFQEQVARQASRKRGHRA